MAARILTGDMKIGALAQWFGGNRKLAEKVGEALRGCEWVGVPFAGGMSELCAVDARTINVSDLHCHIINLAEVVAHPELGRKLYRELRKKGFHELTHRMAQNRCKSHWEIALTPESIPNYEAGRDYFIASWMNRSSTSGIDDEFTGKIPVRWNANGGDSCKRFRSAVESLKVWWRIFERCTFLVRDAFEVLESSKDQERHGVYVDPPFPGVGQRYKHNCGETEADEIAWHTRLRDALVRFQKAVVVCRFYDHPLIRELYPETQWNWRFLDGRDQRNNDKPEVLLIRNSQRELFP